MNESRKWIESTIELPSEGGPESAEGRRFSASRLRSLIAKSEAAVARAEALRPGVDATPMQKRNYTKALNAAKRWCADRDAYIRRFQVAGPAGTAPTQPLDGGA